MATQYNYDSELMPPDIPSLDIVESTVLKQTAAITEPLKSQVKGGQCSKKSNRSKTVSKPLKVLKTLELLNQKLNQKRFVVVIFSSKYVDLDSLEHKLQAKWQDLEERYAVFFYKCIIDSNEENEFKHKYSVEIERHLITRTIASSVVKTKIVFFRNGQPFRSLVDLDKTETTLTCLERELKEWIREARASAADNNNNQGVNLSPASSTETLISTAEGIGSSLSTADTGDDTRVTLNWYPLVENSANFTICDKNEGEIMNKLYRSMTDSGHLNSPMLPSPNILICCSGTSKYFSMSDALEREFMTSISQMATAKGVWLVTEGLNSGVSKLIGESVYRHMLLNEKSSPYALIGITGWYALTEHTRRVLKLHTKMVSNEMHQPSSGPMRLVSRSSVVKRLDPEEEQTLNRFHSHHILFTAASSDYHISDQYRSEFVDTACRISNCYALTIVIEGDYNALPVIQNDLEAKRPVILVQGSGCVASILGNLIENSKESFKIKTEHILRELKKFSEFVTSKNFSATKVLTLIKDILRPQYRKYIFLFKLGTHTSLVKVIYEALHDVELRTSLQRENLEKETLEDEETSECSEIDEDDSTVMESDEEAIEKEEQRDNDARHRQLLHLTVTWNHLAGAQTLLDSVKDPQIYYPQLFERSLKENRPIFVDYILRRCHNPLHTTEFKRLEANKRKSIMNGLLEKTDTQLRHFEHFLNDTVTRTAFEFIFLELYGKTKSPCIGIAVPSNVAELDAFFERLVGSYANSLFEKKNTRERLRNDFGLFWRRCKCFFYDKDVPESSEASKDLKRNVIDPSSNAVYSVVVNLLPDSSTKSQLRIDSQERVNGSEFQSRYKLHHYPTINRQQMLREIFLWSVFAGYSDIAFVVLLQLESRMSAALIATSMARCIAKSAINADTFHAYEKQACDYEAYATACVNACNTYNKQRTCEILLRENPLFGSVTCMQTAIASRSVQFINSDGCKDVLNRQWFGSLFSESNGYVESRLKFLLCLLTFGLLAPIFIENNQHDANSENLTTIKRYINDETQHSDRWKGIEESSTEDDVSCCRKIYDFHSTPVVRMVYDFVFYTWFLLVFSYVMLFRMKSEKDRIHWTMIYVIITVVAMLLESIRKIIVDYHTQTLETRRPSNTWLFPTYVVPYVLFFVGILIYNLSSSSPSLFSTAKIVLAIDLELWYLFSLRFVSTMKLFGPRLFMIRNMICDMIGTLYIILMCIAAYCVVSRAIFPFYESQFTLRNIFTAIFYQSYWILYSIADAEIETLEKITMSNMKASTQVTEATVVHVLLAFHMFFINILILILIISLFRFSTNNAQQETEYLWQRRRYESICAYFQQPMFAFPPFNLLTYFYWLIDVRCGGATFRVFRYLCKSSDSHTEWSDFENAATYDHARTFVEENYRTEKKSKIKTLQSQIDMLKLENEEIRHHVDDVQKQKRRAIEQDALLKYAKAE